MLLHYPRTVVPRVRVRRVQLQRVLEVMQCLGTPPFAKARHAQLVHARRQPGGMRHIGLRCTLVRRQCLLRPPKALQHAAHFHQHLPPTWDCRWKHHQSAIVARYCILEASSNSNLRGAFLHPRASRVRQCSQRRCLIVPRPRVSRGQAQRLLAARQCLFRPPQPPQHVAATVVCFHVGRCQRYGACVAALRLPKSRCIRQQQIST